ncbi:unnamed protein product [Prorocentrum cordatum]|uniref:EF-hand domain-containing protein n=1 Tax=Prorocentrum cordatum TaxID=2364126 RepID=A0ABN9SBZ1_9DINO|nr:unnamed protein product [Polarella glacialis]
MPSTGSRPQLRHDRLLAAWRRSGRRIRATRSPRMGGLAASSCRSPRTPWPATRPTRRRAAGTPTPRRPPRGTAPEAGRGCRGCRWPAARTRRRRSGRRLSRRRRRSPRVAASTTSAWTATRRSPRTRSARQEQREPWGPALLMTPKFDTVLGVVIVLNSAMIGVEMTLVEGEARNATILQPTPETLPFMVCENIFLLIYCVEIFLRIFACRWDAFASGWVRFDALLVFVGISGTWILPVVTLLFLPTGGGSAASVPMVLRVFRLARLARALRLLPHFRPLWMLVHGMTSSASTIMNVFVVLFMTLYVFGCIANEIGGRRITNHEKRKDGGWFDDTVELYFRSLPMSMVTLIQFVSFDSVGQIYRPMIQAAPELLCFFVPFLLIVSIVLMNLVTAIIVEAFLAHAKEDNEMRKKEQERRVQSMIPQLKRMFEEMDEDGSGTLTLDELEDAPDYLKEELSKCLDTESLIELWEILDNHCMGEVSIEEFCEGITKVATSAQPMEFTRIMKQLSFLREDLDMVLQKVCPNKKPRFTRARRSSGSVLHRRTEELRNSVEPETDRRQSAKTDISGESESNGQCQASSVPLEESDHEGSPQSRCARQSTTSNADSSTATRLARRNIRQSAVHIVARPRHVRATVEAGRNFAAAMAEKDLAREGTPNGRTTTTPHVSSAAQPPARRVSGGPSRLRTSRPSNGSHT